MVGPSAKLPFYRFMSTWGFLLPTLLWFLCRLGKSVFLCRVYMIECLLDIVWKSSLVHTSVCPNITTIAILFVGIVSANVNISVYFCWFPASLSVSDSLVELAFVARSICPDIFAFSVEFAVLVLAFVFISVNKHFNPEAFFDWLYKSTIVVLFLR